MNRIIRLQLKRWKQSLKRGCHAENAEVLYTIWTDSSLATYCLVALVVDRYSSRITAVLVLRREMTRERWLMGLFTYLVPYTVSIHGQYSTRSRHRISPSAENRMLVSRKSLRCLKRDPNNTS